MIIKSKIKNYTIKTIENIFLKKDLILSTIQFKKAIFFIDRTVFRIYKEDLKSLLQDNKYFLIEAKEENKSYMHLVHYYRLLISNNCKKNDLLIAIGGGITQDICGFISSTIFRGIKWIFIPTTLLAQADSCIGSKTSINFDDTKNLIGTFYPPDSIFIDTAFCKTLSAENFNSGVGEIIKFHLMSGKKEYSLLKKFLGSTDLKNNRILKTIILSTLRIKKSYFEKDEYDTGRRNLLNYGHCFGHALESASGFSVSHGEAVIVGMGFANLLSLKRHLIKQKDYVEMETILKERYPKIDLKKINAATIIKFLKKDKKRITSDLSMILTRGIGKQYKYNDIKETEIKKTYKDFSLNYVSR